MPISIRTRLTITFTAVIALVLLLSNIVLSRYSTQTAEQHANRVLREGMKSATRSFKEEWDESREELAASGRLSVDPAKPIAAAIRHTRQELSDDHVDVAFVENGSGTIIRSEAGEAGLPWPARTNSGWHIASSQVTSSHHALGGPEFTIAVGIPWYQTLAELHEQDMRVGFVSLLFVVLSAIGTWILVGYTLRPIGKLADQARSFREAAGGSSDRIQLTPSSPDAEVVGLVRTLNLLMDSVADNAEAKARFYTAASHELRTPLHVLCGQVELTLSRPRSADAYEAAMVEVQEQTERLTTIIESLLLLNRLDRGTQEAPLRDTLIDQVCAQQLCILSPGIFSRRLQMESDVTLGEPQETSRVSAPQMHAEIMVRNLTENAVKYGSEGGHIRLSIDTSSADGVWVHVYNDAAPIPPEAFERLFEAFYRPDDSRTARTGGNGLGLSICRALADANGWKLTLSQTSTGVQADVFFARQSA